MKYAVIYARYSSERQNDQSLKNFNRTTRTNTKGVRQYSKSD